jgi:tetratricopeptide (TPR) repeat protein
VAAAVFFSKKALADADEDLKTANTALQQNSQDYDAYLKRGDAYWTKFMLDPAIADYSTAIALHPERSDAYDKRANVYDMQKRFGEAQSDRKRSKELRKAPW